MVVVSDVVVVLMGSRGGRCGLWWVVRGVGGWSWLVVVGGGGC